MLISWAFFNEGCSIINIDASSASMFLSLIGNSGKSKVSHALSFHGMDIHNTIKNRIFSVSSLYVFALVLLPLAGYLTGRAQVVEINNPEIKIDNSEIDCGCENFAQPEDENVDNPEGQSASDLKFVASKNGSKYYPIDCKSAESIKEENRVFFGTAEEAEASGKTKSTKCE